MFPSPLLGLSSLCVPGALSAMARLSASAVTELLLLRYCGISIYFSLFGSTCQAVKGLLLGLTTSRQSKSPLARPSTSISAVAMLLA